MFYRNFRLTLRRLISVQQPGYLGVLMDLQERKFGKEQFEIILY